MKIKIERCFNCNHHVITLVTKRWEEYECWKCGCGCMTIHRNVRDYPKENQFTKGDKMSPIEHYFENLLTMGSDIKGEPNKNALSREVQEAVEICADYAKYDLLLDDTKANMIAMLEELKKEIIEITISKATVPNEIFWNMGADTMKKEIGTRIQQKINSLKEANHVDKT